jgi:hypothetical protein
MLSYLAGIGVSLFLKVGDSVGDSFDGIHEGSLVSILVGFDLSLDCILF